MNPLSPGSPELMIPSIPLPLNSSCQSDPGEVPVSCSYSARTGIGSLRISWFQGSLIQPRVPKGLDSPVSWTCLANWM